MKDLTPNHSPEPSPAHPSVIQAFNLLQQAQLHEAQTLCKDRLSQSPDDALARNLMGHILIATEHFSDALASFQQAVKLAPQTAMHHAGCGIALEYLANQGQASLQDAMGHYAHALMLEPDSVHSNYLHARLAHQLGQLTEARESYQRVLKLDSQHEATRFHLAALIGEGAPATAPQPYVAGLFQNYAPTFEKHLTQELGYTAPDHLQQQIARNLPPGRYDILDLGCGTGLAGLAFKPWARRLVGIDLSPAMIEQARKKAIYDELIAGEISHELTRHEQHYDLIVAADVLIYIGDLTNLFESAYQTLHSMGYFAFSIETTHHDGFYLKSSRRYGHALNYVLQTAQRCGFGVLELRNIVLRTENGQPLRGYAVLLVKPTTQALGPPDPA